MEGAHPPPPMHNQGGKVGGLLGSSPPTSSIKMAAMEAAAGYRSPRNQGAVTSGVGEQPVGTEKPEKRSSSHGKERRDIALAGGSGSPAAGTSTELVNPSSSQTIIAEATTIAPEAHQPLLASLLTAIVSRVVQVRFSESPPSIY